MTPRDAAAHDGDGREGHKKLAITRSLSIPLSELHFRFSRSGGPGGQNVNKVNSKVTLWFNISASPSLTPEQKHLLITRLSARLTREGDLQLSSSEQRSQQANRQAVLVRLQGLLRQALVVRKVRRPTKPSRGAKERRLHSKKRRGNVKQQRQKVSRSKW